MNDPTFEGTDLEPEPDADQTFEGTTAKDEVVAGDAWEFDSEVTAVFDNMLERSIPQYWAMRNLVAELGARSLFSRSTVVDVGCSRGDALASIIERTRPDQRLTYYGIEVSGPMREAAHDRFADDPRVSILHRDLVDDDPFQFIPPASLVLSVLTLCFIPLEERFALLERMRNLLSTNGTLILVEKIIAGFPEYDRLLVDLYLDGKRAAGYTDEQIERKKLALRGVLVPLTAAWNEDMLRRAGFDKVECFWRCANFAGWIAR